MNINKRATIKEVARAAGVSTQTVSRVINDRPDVSPETRERIQQVIAELDYQPSALARSLIQQRSYTLGVVTAGLKFIGPSRTLNGITNKAEELGYALLLEEMLQFDTDNIKPRLQNLLARHVDGIVWAVPEVGDNRRWVDEILNDVPVPVVFLTMEPRPNASTVSVDNYAGGVIAVQHLLDLGRREIGHISGPLDWWEARQRKRAWQDTLKKAGLEPADNHCTEGNWSSSSGEAAFEQLLHSYPEMDAVFVANDQMALSTLRLANRRGINIPGNLAVVGFDNMAESAYFWPALTTINHKQHELGCRAVEEVVSQIEAVHRGEKVEPGNIFLSPELIRRESSGGE
ncbi:MAG TPA: LacI family DNA-binding transcriptional regulator [Anaerolineales bacterium]|nr:LacI family DNA-binding transcriptional regulator [Anaerolineales bacterium]